MQAGSRKPIPAALRPRAAAPEPVATPAPGPIHLAVVVPDARVYDYFKKNVRVLQPNGGPPVQLHVLVDDPKHRAAGVDWQIRLALLETGVLLNNQDADPTPPEQITLGWPTGATND